MIRSMLVFILLFVAAAQCGAESLQVTTTSASTEIKRGVPVVMNVNLKNVLTSREPVTITAEAEWEDEYGAIKTTTASTTITVVQPVKINRYKVAIPALFGFEAGSAKVGGQPPTPGLDAGQLDFDMSRTLLVGESVALEYLLKAQ